MRRAPAIMLVLMALAIALPGMVGLVAPRSFLAQLGLGALSVDALNDARAVGGTRLGIAIVLLGAAFLERWRRPGLVVAIVIFGATLVGRVLSSALDGMPGAMMKPEVAEAVVLALAAGALAMTTPKPA